MLLQVWSLWRAAPPPTAHLPPPPVPDWRLLAEPDMALVVPSLQLPSDCSVLRDRVLSLSLDTCHVTTPSTREEAHLELGSGVSRDLLLTGERVRGLVPGVPHT